MNHKLSSFDELPEALLAEPIWGIVLHREYRPAPRRAVETPRIVTNVMAYHPKAVVASRLTYAEAKALLKVIGETE